MAASTTGKLFVTVGTDARTTRLVSSEDGGTTWSAPEELTTPDGALYIPQILSRGGVTAVVGSSDSAAVWFRRIE